MLFANGDALPTPNHCVRLYAHEATRVYSDKLVDNEDKAEFTKLMKDALQKNIEVIYSSSDGIIKSH